MFFFVIWLRRKLSGGVQLKCAFGKLAKTSDWNSIWYIYTLDFLVNTRGKLSVRQPAWKMSSNSSWPAWQYWLAKGSQDSQDLINGLIWLSTRKHKHTDTHSHLATSKQTNKHSYSRPVGYLKCYKCFGNWLRIDCLEFVFQALHTISPALSVSESVSNVLNNAARANNKYIYMHIWSARIRPVDGANKHLCHANGLNV